MVKSVIIDSFGGANKLKYIETNSQDLKAGEIRIQQKYIGLSFYDICARRGDFQSKFPQAQGFEASGVIVETKGDVGNYVVGDRVGYFLAPQGSYTDERVLDYRFTYKIPDHVSDEQAVSIGLKGSLAHMLLLRTFMVKAGMWILINAAAGGVGSYISQLARKANVKIIGTVGKDEKIDFAKQNGCDFVINYNKKNIFDEITEITKGKMVNVVYDGVGSKLFEQSIKSINDFGLYSYYGWSSGPIEPIDNRILTEKGLFFTSPSVFQYKKDRNELVLTMSDLFDLLSNNDIKDNITTRFKFNEIEKAHNLLESGESIGSIVIKI